MKRAAIILLLIVAGCSTPRLGTERTLHFTVPPVQYEQTEPLFLPPP